MAGKRLFCKRDCSQAYHSLQIADERSIEMLSFIFASRTFAHRRLAQGLNQALSACFSFMSEYLGKVIKADQYTPVCRRNWNSCQWRLATDQQHNLRAFFQYIQKAALKLTMHECHFGATKNDVLRRTIAPEGVPSQRSRVQDFREKTNFPKSKKALQKWFLNYYRDYVPRLSEKITPFFK